MTVQHMDARRALRESRAYSEQADDGEALMDWRTYVELSAISEALRGLLIVAIAREERERLTSLAVPMGRQVTVK